jgi:hypothetical protein
MNKKSYDLFLIPSLISGIDCSKDVMIVEYKGKLVITCMDEEHSFVEL